jgi:hypothetical protein
VTKGRLFDEGLIRIPPVNDVKMSWSNAAWLFYDTLFSKLKKCEVVECRCL